MDLTHGAPRVDDEIPSSPLELGKLIVVVTPGTPRVPSSSVVNHEFLTDVR